MKKPVRGMAESELPRRYPVKGTTPGWYFRVTETSSNAWLVEGMDAFGRIVGHQGLDPEELLARCDADAAKISEQLG